MRNLYTKSCRGHHSDRRCTTVTSRASETWQHRQSLVAKWLFSQIIICDRKLSIEKKRRKLQSWLLFTLAHHPGKNKMLMKVVCRIAQSLREHLLYFLLNLNHRRQAAQSEMQTCSISNKINTNCLLRLKMRTVPYWRFSECAQQPILLPATLQKSMMQK